MPQAETNQYLAPAEAAQYLGVSVDLLAQWRCKRRVPLPFVKIGKLVRYRMRDLERFLADNTVTCEPRQ